MKATATAKNSKLRPDSRGPERVAVLTTGARSTRTLDAYPNARVRNGCSPVASGGRVSADTVPIRRAADPHLREAARRYAAGSGHYALQWVSRTLRRAVAASCP